MFYGGNSCIREWEKLQFVTFLKKLPMLYIKFRAGAVRAGRSRSHIALMRLRLRNTGHKYRHKNGLPLAVLWKFKMALPDLVRPCFSGHTTHSKIPARWFKTCDGSSIIVFWNKLKSTTCSWPRFNWSVIYWRQADIWLVTFPHYFSLPPGPKAHWLPRSRVVDPDWIRI
jgi:hypothetical protein